MEKFIGFEVLMHVIMMGYNAVYFRDRPTIRRYKLPPSSGLKSKPSKKPTEAVSKPLLVCLVGLLFCLEDGGVLVL
jgi:hypothetical protein